MMFENLDLRTRSLMGVELDYDLERSALYLSSRLVDGGRDRYIQLLRESFVDGVPASLSASLRQAGLFRSHEERRTKSGTTMAKVPVTAPETLAEGEFNRFYMRALCLRVIQDATGELVVYRAKPVNTPRAESEALIGKVVPAVQLLNDLRTHPGVEPALGLPPGPNSGLSLRLAVAGPAA